MDALSAAIAKAAKEAFLDLFSNKEKYYYCTLVTTEEGFTPLVSAWSWEALDCVAQQNSDPRQ
ncbi:MAG: DUF4303 domain-containing protein [Pseudomonadota bacterium]|nr:DUF4303 domain-containing protein [Pseudomonadota bacterium]